MVPGGAFPRSKDLSCCPDIWTFTEPGMKSSFQFYLSALSLSPGLHWDSLPHSFWFFYATGMWPDKAVTSYLLASLFFQNWVLDAKCIYSQ